MSERAEDRLRRVADELKAVIAQVDAMPLLAPAAREPLRLAALDVVHATGKLARAVIEAAHRAPGPEDL